MIKKRLLSGEPCKKCQQAEEVLRGRGLWERLDEVVWAQEGDADSPGMQLAAEHGVELAPFFIARDPGQSPRVYTSVIKFIKAELADAATTAAPPGTDDTLAAAAERLDETDPVAILRYALGRFGARCAISFSGAEDVVLIDMASKLGLPFSVFSLDTGRLHAETYRFIDEVRKRYGAEIQLMTPKPELLEPFVRQKGLFSFYEDGHGECCRIRKVEPLRRALSTFEAWATGQRKDQSVTRADLPVLQADPAFTGSAGELWKFNPLANWSSDRVWQYIRDNDVPFNSLHERGFISIGCEPCTRATRPGEHERAGRWWWEAETHRECGLHVGRK